MTGKDLKEKYPLAFSQMPMEPILLFGLEIDEGWIPLIEVMCRRMYGKINVCIRQIEYYDSCIEKCNKEDGDLIASYNHKKELVEKNLEDYIDQLPTFTQIKEKYGSLRIYTSKMNEYYEGMIEMAEDMSEHICEKCGDKGRLYSIHWHKTLCDKHADERYGDAARIFRESH
jgi:hypothetical protein